MGSQPDMERAMQINPSLRIDWQGKFKAEEKKVKHLINRVAKAEKKTVPLILKELEKLKEGQVEAEQTKDENKKPGEPDGSKPDKVGEKAAGFFAAKKGKYFYPASAKTDPEYAKILKSLKEENTVYFKDLAEAEAANYVLHPQAAE